MSSNQNSCEEVTTTHNGLQSLAQQIRSFRQKKGYTLEDVSKLTGVAKSTISKIENNQVSPSFEIVHALAKGLAIDLPQLFDSAPKVESKPLGRLDISRASEGHTQITSTYQHRLLATGLSNKKLFPYVTTVRARSRDEYSDWIRHEGEELLFILKGSVTLYSEFYEPLVLQQGDSAYYDCQMGHLLVSISTEDAEVLWVTV